jgi:hypothetical protein
MPNQEAGLNHDHRMCRAVLHANPRRVVHLQAQHPVQPHCQLRAMATFASARHFR